QGPEFTCRALDQWAFEHGVELRLIQPGKPTQNGFIESFKEGANKQVISSQADSLIKISRIWADFFPANT
ncbi:integrase core domain-containing protein, partial [Klebsiella quasipneumoniae]|uniref:integrase core domain-containing protein n=1 Tax=Klebsiella quasipneumoniae TaxID=1463165 RepID=UPI002ABB9705